MSETECPYCADPGLLQRALTPTSNDLPTDRGAVYQAGAVWANDVHKGHSVRTLRERGTLRGDFTVQPITDKDLARRFAGFRIELVGRRVDYDPPSPPGQFFHKDVAMTFGGAEPDISCQIFDGCRVTKKGSAITVDVHWWPDHGLKLIPSGLETLRDHDTLDKALRLFRPETRGAQPKITDEKVQKTLAMLGAGATQGAAAKALKVSQTALEQWRRRQGIKTWQEVVIYYTGA